jgi:putative photosynthetic complex assembly protein 2
MSTAGPVLYALFVWWFSTGLIIWLDNLPARTFRWSMAGGTALFAVALWQLAATSADGSAPSVYAAFTWAVLAWGWHEMAFFMGYITGPRRTACPVGCGGWAHFRHGFEACLWHELAILATGAVIVWASWGAPNQAGTWTFMVLWAGRTSAKLNFFLGVRNLGEEFLPERLVYLKSFFRRRAMNRLMPFSVVAGLIWLAALADTPGSVGRTFVMTMLTLALVEHVVLVLPLPFARLWGWAVTERRAAGRDALLIAPKAGCASGGHTHIETDAAGAAVT